MAANLTHEELVQKVIELQQGVSELGIKELDSHRGEIRSREQAVSQREARLAEREAELARREAALFSHEAGLASVSASAYKGDESDCRTPDALKALMTPTPARSVKPVPQQQPQYQQQQQQQQPQHQTPQQQQQYHPQSARSSGSVAALSTRLSASSATPVPPLPAISLQAISPSKQEPRPAAAPPQLASRPAPAQPAAAAAVNAQERRVAPLLDSRAVTFMELRAELMGREQLSEMQLRGYWQTLQPATWNHPEAPESPAPSTVAATPSQRSRRLSGPSEGSASKLKAMWERSTSIGGSGAPSSGTSTSGAPSAARSGSIGSIGSGPRNARRTAPPMTMTATLSNAAPTQPQQSQQSRQKMSLADLLAADEAASLESVRPSAAECAAAQQQQQQQQHQHMMPPPPAGEPYAAREALPAETAVEVQEWSSRVDSIDRMTTSSDTSSMQPYSLAPAPAVSLAELLRRDEAEKLRAMHGGSIQ